MLNKDQYNQDEYNDYYRQETQGAEISESEEKSSIIGKVLMLLVLIALAIAGYFGYQMMNEEKVEDMDTSLQVSIEPSLPQSIQSDSETEEVNTAEVHTPEVEVVSKEKAPIVKTVQTEVVEETPVATLQTTVTQEVSKVVSTQSKMSPEEVAAVVAAVMQQMNQQKNTETGSSTSTAIKQDIQLMDKLSETEVDSVSANLMKELEGVDLSENTHVDSSTKQVDVYNKVNVQNVAGADTLSQLSEQINSLIQEGVGEDKAKSYTQSLKSEVDVRKNEMRIIVVRKGDTLGRIAKRAYGNVMDYKRIYRANPEVTRPDRIYVGQKLRIPN